MLLRRIQAYLLRHEMAPARFGREAMGDPSFVPRLKCGRTPRAASIARVEAFLARDGGPEDAFDRSAG